MLIIETIRTLCMCNSMSSNMVLTHLRAWLTPHTLKTLFQTFESIANTPDISKLCYLLVHFWFQTFQSFANTSHVSEVANISNLCVSNKRGTEKQMKLGGV